jgi:hypothetical protein
VTKLSSSALRWEIGQRNARRAVGFEHEVSYGGSASVVYRDDDGVHGNFLPGSYRAICARAEWRQRLTKSYTGGRWMARAGERKRFELDCANSSDALLMNVFCYPKLLERPAMGALLGVAASERPEFGYRPRVPLLKGTDRTEIDMRLGELLVEAKLTETGLQTVPARLVRRYRDLEEVFDVEELPMDGERVRAYQAIRGVLAAHASECSFALLCDARREDLREGWFRVLRAVRSYSFRNRLKLVTWQEISGAAPKVVQRFLMEKYGIASA